MTSESAENQKLSLKIEGRTKFDRAFFKAFWDEMSDVVAHKPVGLLSYDEVKARLHLSDSHYRGLQDIPLERIVGSVGRYRDFTRNFLPKKPNMADRWSNVYAQINSLEGVPPIDVFQVDDVYFVRDGNHRVSIAREMGLKTIEAYVTEMRTPVDLEPDMTYKQFDAAAAYADFLEYTKLDQNRTQQKQITLSEPEHYHNLIDHIYMVKHVHEHEMGQEMSLEDAACRWYDIAYEPCVELIEKYKVMEHFPKRTEADLYIWIIGHFKRLLEEYEQDTHMVGISDALVEFLASNKMPIPKRLIEEDDDKIS